MSQAITVFESRNRWVVNIPAAPGRKRQRKSFVEKLDAEAHRDQLEDRVAEHGRKGLDVGGVTVAQAIEKFYFLKEMEERHRRDSKHVLNLFAKKYGSWPIALIGPEELTGFWRQTRKEKGKKEPVLRWKKTSQARVYRYLRLFFNFCERYDIIEKNPIRKVEIPKASDPPKNIFSPEEMEEELKRQDDIFHAFLCLGGFLGIRTSEQQTLDENDFKPLQIRVNRGTKEERWVTRTEAFNANWRGLPKFPAAIQNFYDHIREVYGGKWPPNVLRHSFGTYHLALWENAASTSHQMGNSEKVVKKDYARGIEKAEAVKFFTIGLTADQVKEFLMKVARVFPDLAPPAGS